MKSKDIQIINLVLITLFSIFVGVIFLAGRYSGHKMSVDDCTELIEKETGK